MSQLPEIRLGDRIGFLTCEATILHALLIPAKESTVTRYLMVMYKQGCSDPFVVCYLDAQGWQGKEWENGYHTSNAQAAMREYSRRISKDVVPVS